MMNPRRLSTLLTPLLRSVIFAGGVVGLFVAFGPAGVRNTGATPSNDNGTASLSAERELGGPPQPGPIQQDEFARQPDSIPKDDLAQTDVAMAEPLMAEPLLAGAVADASIALDKPVAPDKPEPVVETAPTNAPDAPSAEPPPVQVASANPFDLETGDTRDAGKAVSSVEIVDECLVVEICVDRYLWTLYQRTPKEDTIKEFERRKVAIKRKRKTVMVTRTFTKLVDEDFGWKDPKAAERARMSMMDYVIGGMDRNFKLKLFHTLHAAEAAGLTPGITSAFRDDYRQSIASGLKAASNRSYHGGSLRGGYGHGLAADIVSIEGKTRSQRWASSDRLWKWVDAHGKEFGIGRPYLGRDPPHVAPVDGREYASHNRGSNQAGSDAKKTKRVAKRNDSKVAKRPRTAAVSKLKSS